MFPKSNYFTAEFTMINTEITDNDCQTISNAFLSLYEKEGFSIIPPSSLLHDSVPMSFVMSAGLIQVENNLDKIIKKTKGKFVFNQPCFRHFDMKQVGKDSTHLSLFNMSAAFHVGSIKRLPMLSSLWHYMINILKLKKENLWVTYLDDEEIGRDNKTYKAWKKIGVEETQLVGLGKDDNFWIQGKTGPIAKDGKRCGPHTEIFYERKEIICNCGETLKKMISNCSCGRFIEISNSLFIKDYISETGQFIPAETIFAESVIGIERIATILQKKKNVYQLKKFDQWKRNINSLISSKGLSSSEKKRSIDIMVEHLYAYTTLINEGAPCPDRGGRAGIMKNLSRGIIQQVIVLDLDLCEVLNACLHTKYDSWSKITLFEESLRFIKTLERGKKELSKLLYANEQVNQTVKNIFQEKHGIPSVLFNKMHYQLINNKNNKNQGCPNQLDNMMLGNKT